MKKVLILILIGVALFCCALGVLVWMEYHVPAPDGNFDAMIVLGAQVGADGKPMRQLELRLEAALQLWQEHPCPIVVCGGQGSNEPAPEGTVMKEWLVAHGVDAENVMADVTSVNTWENLKNARQLLGEGVNRVALVTSRYHLPRALQIARDAGYEACGVGSDILPRYWLRNHGREVLAWCKYFVSRVLPL